MATGDVQGILLDEGKKLITASMSGFSLFAPAKYTIGSSFGFDPDATDTEVRGTVTYEGSAADIQARQLSEDSVRYTVTIDESAGPFNIGNIVIYGTMWNAEPIPLFSVVLPFSYAKTVSTAPVLGNSTYPVPGNRFIINVTIKHSVEADTVNVEVATPLFSSLPQFKDELSYPSPSLNPFKTFIVGRDSRTGTPSFVMTDNDEVQWGIPGWQSIRSPKFGIADGGVAGDGYAPSGTSYLWGQKYLTLEDIFRGTVGGTSYDTELGNFVGNIGGLSY